MPAAVRDDATVNLFRLDPLGRHTHPNLDEMTDLARQWKTVADHRIAIPPTPTTLYPLTASTQPGMDVVAEGIPSSQSPTPGEALVQHRALQAWLTMLQHVAWETR